MLKRFQLLMVVTAEVKSINSCGNYFIKSRTSWFQLVKRIKWLMISNEGFLQGIYDAFNKHDIEIILSMMKEDVKWANGMEGGFVYGRDNVRTYWRKQFETINSQLEATKFETDETGRNVVTVHQIVKDLEGNLLADKIVTQIFTIEDGLIKTFEIGFSEN